MRVASPSETLAVIMPQRSKLANLPAPRPDTLEFVVGDPAGASADEMRVWHAAEMGATRCYSDQGPRDSKDKKQLFSVSLNLVSCIAK